MKQATVLVLVLFTFSALPVFAGEPIENFESVTWPAAPWYTASGGSGATFTAAAHDGVRGYRGTGGWEVMSGVPALAWETYSLWVRHNTAAGGSGRIYLGFGASAGGCHSIVFAPNSNVLQIHDNNGWGFTTLQTVPFVHVPDRWYRLQLTLYPQSVSMRVYDEDGYTRFSTSLYHDFAAPIPVGDLAIRSFGGGMELDNLQRVVLGIAPDGCTTVAEDFESPGWPVGDWVTASGSAGSTLIGAERDGLQGFDSNGGWAADPGFNFVVAGNKLSIWARHNSSAGGLGRVYLGFNADLTGCYSLVFAMNTGELIYQSNVGWGTADLFTTPLGPVLSNQRYRLELHLTSPRSFNLTVYDTDGVSPLAALVLSTTGTNLGGIAIRTIGGMQVDTLELIGPPVLEDFESITWPAPGWTVGFGAPGVTTPAADHDGLRGYTSPGAGWEYNDMVPFGSPGQRLSAWTNGSNGRSYLGFAADSGGCYSFVLIPLTGEIEFQDNSAWGFSVIATNPMFITPGVWYRTEVEFVDANNVVGRVYGPDGSTLVSRLAANIPGGYAPGGIAIRAFGDNQIDTISDFSPGASCGCPTACGDCNHSGTGPDIIDALRAAQLGAGLFPPTLDDDLCCDVNDSGVIDVLDSLRIAQDAVGIFVALSCP